MPPPEPRARAVLEASVSPSEDPAKVVKALRNILGDSAATESEGERSARLRIEGLRGLDHVKEQLRDRHIRSAARRQLLLNRRGNETSLMLNRQAAASGVVALCGSPEESPLGPVYLTIRSGELEAVIDWLAAYSDG